ncbi:hypothetical protein AMEX_G24926 [Astyanax mexicanus]|uniref:Uncharacterized protein n=1 Tax=Astyanax mexicanus TaxID=7994 RepID=A0A8T2KRX8_ASTMX|nr:hypothetical protein AMEX_G24926 [Astyanax mexicanus]
MSNFSSPSKIPKIQDPEADRICERLQLLAYKCRDPAANQAETAQQLCTVATDIMAMMSRCTKQNAGLQQTIKMLRKEREELLEEITKAKAASEAIAATAAFCKDEQQESSTQTPDPLEDDEHTDQTQDDST